jgi:uridine kinase
MKRHSQPKLIAIVGGSGAGKTWLADWLERQFAPDATRLSLDDFYHDFSHVSAAQRPRINFDDPSAIDWLLLETVLRECRAGRASWMPVYDFSSHTRLRHKKAWTPKPFVFVDGLWLLWRPAVRALFDLRIFIEAPEELRWRRRLARDVIERGRTPDSVRAQVHSTVAPMHQRFVEPQARWAEIVLQQPLHECELNEVRSKIREHVNHANTISSGSPRGEYRGGMRGDQSHMTGTPDRNTPHPHELGAPSSRRRVHANQKHTGRIPALPDERESNLEIEPHALHS